jgi:hypothetical protein
VTDASQATRRFFEAYAEAGNALDADRLATFYGQTCLAAAPGFAAATTDAAQLRAALNNVVEFYRGIGRGETRVESLAEQSLGEHHSLVTVGWSTVFPQAGPDRIPFDVSYLIQRNDEWKIIAFVSHEDERAILQERGLLPQA